MWRWWCSVKLLIGSDKSDKVTLSSSQRTATCEDDNFPPVTLWWRHQMRVTNMWTMDAQVFQPDENGWQMKIRKMLNIFENNRNFSFYTVIKTYLIPDVSFWKLVMTIREVRMWSEDTRPVVTGTGSRHHLINLITLHQDPDYDAFQPLIQITGPEEFSWEWGVMKEENITSCCILTLRCRMLCSQPILLSIADDIRWPN